METIPFGRICAGWQHVALKRLVASGIIAVNTASSSWKQIPQVRNYKEKTTTPN